MLLKERMYIRKGDNVFCATYEQHEYIHNFDKESILGDSYQCRHCDDFQVG